MKIDWNIAFTWLKHNVKPVGLVLFIQILWYIFVYKVIFKLVTFSFWKKAADFYDQSSRRILLAVGAYWNPWVGLWGVGFLSLTKIWTEGWGFKEKGRVSLGRLHWNIATKRVYYHNGFVVESNWYPFFLAAQFKRNGWFIGSIWHEVITVTCSRWTRFWPKEATFCFATIFCREL